LPSSPRLDFPEARSLLLIVFSIADRVFGSFTSGRSRPNLCHPHTLVKIHKLLSHSSCKE